MSATNGGILSADREPAALSLAAQVALAYIRKRDYVSYVELDRVLRPHIPTQGDWAATDPHYPNVVFWAGMSEEWLDVLQELLDAQLVWRDVASRLTYMIDGRTLKFPLVKRLPDGGYKQPHWAPICFRPIETKTPHPSRPQKGASPVHQCVRQGQTYPRLE
jgi:hypothetical protein